MNQARTTIRAYRSQRSRFADPKHVKAPTGRAGAAFLAAQGEARDRRPFVPVFVGDLVERQAANGHRYVYRVRGFHPDGTLSTEAQHHSDRCPCWTSEDADYMPNW